MALGFASRNRCIQLERYADAVNLESRGIMHRENLFDT
jgi:hypothetical protein